jgi:predicted transposase YdaD
MVRVSHEDGHAEIVLWEFLSHWKRRAILSLADYTIRALIKFSLPVRPVVLLLQPSPQAKRSFEESGLRFRFTLIRLYRISARTFLQQADIHLLPFIPVMKSASRAVWEAERRIYTSRLPVAEKADLLTAMTIFAGLTNTQLARQLVERRRDLMIQSAAYDMIKQEGFDEGIQRGNQQGFQRGMQHGQLERAKKAVADALEARLNIVPLDVVTALKPIEDVQILEELHRKAVTVEDMQEFRSLLQQILEPA